jgi:hypothetical protein
VLVQNYGLYWRTEAVHWGGPNNEGTLEGVPYGGKRTKPTNFRNQAGVYVLYQDFKPIYVGETGIGDMRLFRRLKGHRKNQLANRWNSFSWFGIYPVNKVSRNLRSNVRVHPEIGDVLYHIEAILIAAMEPALNLQRGKFGKAQRYIQHESKGLPLDQFEMTEEILRLVRRNST